MPYVYRHIRLDKNEPFYIGMSQSTTNYGRAYEIRSRSKLWHNIVSKTKYEVEIIYNCEDIEVAKQKEIEFIALYGRIDKGTGTLTNHTDGGNGTFIARTEAKLLEENTYKEKKHNHRKVIDFSTSKVYNTIRQAAESIGVSSSVLQGYLIGKCTNKTSFLYLEDFEKGLKPEDIFENKAVKKVIDEKTKEVFESITYLCLKSGISYDKLWSYLSGKRINKTNYILLEDYERGIKANELKINKRIIEVIDIITLDKWDSITLAALDNDLACGHLSRMLNGDTFNKTNMMYVSEFEKGLLPNHNYISKSNIKQVIDTFTGIVYISARKASENLGMNYTTFVGKLNGTSSNETSYMYLSDYEKLQ